MKKRSLTKTRNTIAPLGMSEELILLAIRRLGAEASGPAIRSLLEQATKQKISHGPIYPTIRRLEEKGHVVSKQGDARTEASGKSRRYFHLTNTGRAVLKQMAEIRLMIEEHKDAD